MACHILVECAAWVPQRHSLTAIVGQNLSLQTIVLGGNGLLLREGSLAEGGLGAKQRERATPSLTRELNGDDARLPFINEKRVDNSSPITTTDDDLKI